MNIKIIESPNEPIRNLMKNWVESVYVPTHEPLIITEEYIENLIKHDIIKRDSNEHSLLKCHLGQAFTVSIDF